jgi:hypothetical protein
LCSDSTTKGVPKLLIITSQIKKNRDTEKILVQITSVESPFNVPQVMVFLHLTFNFSAPKSMMCQMSSSI